MNDLSPQENAVAAIRISSVKQGLQGDSPEHQKEQIERFAQSHNIHIKKFFIFMESASKEEQPVQEAIDYCKNPKNDIQLFVIKSIDRFTRGGSYLYDHLKMQLVRYGVRLVDIYGVIGNQEINTLDHLGIKYDWSVYSPTKKSEILEAERAKDEMRDIMTRMIGAEIRYVRLGYRVRPAPFGYVNEKVETPHGKRVILKPHSVEATWIIKMFELRSRGTMSDQEIIDEINSLGFHSRKQYVRDSQDRTKVIGEKGGNKLTLKQLWRYIQNPIYAGINIEKWTEAQPVKGKFEGLVKLETFNKANKGKRAFVEEAGEIKLWKEKIPDWRLKKVVKNPKFPYKRYVLCPHCQKPLFGSASRGKLGKYYPAYHCNKRGHYFRVAQKDFNDTITNFVTGLKITEEYVEQLKTFVMDEWNQRKGQRVDENQQKENKILTLRTSAQAIAHKISLLSSETAIKYMEEDLLKIEQEMKELEQVKVENKPQEVSMEIVMANVEYFLAHFEFLLLKSPNRLKRGAYFGLVFDEAPTYEEISSGTPRLAPFIKLKDKLQSSESELVPNCDPTGSRIPVCRMRICRPRPLDDGAICYFGLYQYRDAEAT